MTTPPKSERAETAWTAEPADRAAWIDLASHVAQIAGRAMQDKLALIPNEGKPFLVIASAHSTLSLAAVIIHRLMDAEPTEERVRTFVREIAAAWSLSDAKAQASVMCDVLEHHFGLSTEDAP